MLNVKTGWNTTNSFFPDLRGPLGTHVRLGPRQFPDLENSIQKKRMVDKAHQALEYPKLPINNSKLPVNKSHWFNCQAMLKLEEKTITMTRLIFSLLLLLSYNLFGQPPVNTPFENYLDLKPGRILNYHYSEKTAVTQESANLEIKVLSNESNSLGLLAKITFYHHLTLGKGSKIMEYNSHYPPLDSSRVIFDQIINKEGKFIVDIEQGRITRLNSGDKYDLQVSQKVLRACFGMGFNQETIDLSIFPQQKDWYTQHRNFTRTEDKNANRIEFQLTAKDSILFERAGYGWIDYDPSKHIPVHGKQWIVSKNVFLRGRPDTLVTEFDLIEEQKQEIVFSLQNNQPGNIVSLTWNQHNFYPHKRQFRAQNKEQTLTIAADRTTQFTVSSLHSGIETQPSITFLASPGDTVDLMYSDSLSFSAGNSHAISAKIFEHQEVVKNRMVIQDSLTHFISPPWTPMQYLSHHLSDQEFLDTLAYYQREMKRFLDKESTGLSPEMYRYLYNHIIYDVAHEKMSVVKKDDQNYDDLLAEATVNNPDAEGVEMYHDFMRRMIMHRYNQVKNSNLSPKPTDLYLFARLMLSGYSLYVESARLLYQLPRGATYRVENIYQDIRAGSSYDFFLQALENYYLNIVQFGSLSKGEKIPWLDHLLDSTDIDFPDQPLILVVLQQNAKAGEKLARIFKDSIEPADYNYLFVWIGNPEEETLQKLDSTIGQHVFLSNHHPLFNHLSSYGNYYLLLDRNHRIFSSSSLPVQVSAEKWKTAASVVKDPADFKPVAEIMALILALSLVSFGSVTVYKRRKHQKEQLLHKIRDFELKALRSQMNPHFLFNALNSIQAMINKDEVDRANQYLVRFAKLMRMVLNNSRDNFVPLQQELEAIKIYCELEQLRYQFKFEINVDSKLDQNNFELPGMLIQPLVENAVIHAMSIKKEEGKLEINLEQQDDVIIIKITDNGPGYTWKYVPESVEKHGLDLVYERLQLLRKKYDVQIQLEVSRLARGGTQSLIQVQQYE